MFRDVGSANITRKPGKSKKLLPEMFIAVPTYCYEENSGITSLLKFIFFLLLHCGAVMNVRILYNV